MNQDHIKVSVVSATAVLGSIPLSQVHLLIASLVLLTALYYNVLKIISWHRRNQKTKESNE
jgi:hypothetical protein